MKIYAGAPAAARQYGEADRGRADDYYLTEGAGVARRFSVTGGRVTELAPLTGGAYESWVAGCDPGTGEPRGQLRGDGHAVAVRRGGGQRSEDVVAGGRPASGHRAGV